MEQFDEYFSQAVVRVNYKIGAHRCALGLILLQREEHRDPGEFQRTILDISSPKISSGTNDPKAARTPKP